MSVKQALDNFAFDIIDDAKSILNKKKKNASKSLSDSLDYKLKISKNSFSLVFTANDYWEYVDRGVKGKGGKKADGTQWKTKRVVNSPFKYRNKKPPAKVFDKWVIKRGLAPRTKGGAFKSRKSITNAIATSVFHTGLETTNFITTSFKRHFKKLPDEVVKAYGLTVDKLLNFGT